MICECQTEILCEDCYEDHVGAEHKKIFITDVPKMLPQLLQKRLIEADQFFKGYKTTESGRFFEAYVDFFEKCNEAAVQLRDHYDKQDPWSKQTPQLAKYTQSKNDLMNLKNKYANMRKKEEKDLIDMLKEYNEIAQRMDKSKDELTSGGGRRSNKIFNVDYNREKVRSQVKDYVNAMFLSIFKPESAVSFPPSVVGQGVAVK